MVEEIITIGIILAFFVGLILCILSLSRKRDAKSEMESDTINYVRNVIEDMEISFLDPRIQIEDKNPGKCITINLNNSAIKLVCCEHSPSMVIIDDDTGSKKVEIEEIANQISFNTLYNRILKKMMLKHSV